MSGVFLSYRQNHRMADDRTELRVHAQVVEAIAERLGRHFGADAVFLDTNSMRPAAPYPNQLEKRLRGSDVVIAVIHREWLEDLEERRNRADPGKDWVHFELATALADGIPVLPLLLDGARAPLRREIPPDIGALELLQAHRIQFRHWERDIRRLINTVAEYVPTGPLPQESAEPPPSTRSWYAVAATGAAAALAPGVLTRLLAPDASTRPLLLAAVAGVLSFLLVMLLLMVTVMYVLRRPLDALDRASAERPHDEKTNIILGLTIAGMGIIVLLSNSYLPAPMRLLSLAVTVGAVIVFGAQWLLNRKEAGAWPKTRLPAHPASVRDALAQVQRRLDEWEAPLSRMRHDQLRYALDQVRRSTARLDGLRRQGRPAWLRSSPAVLVHAHIASLGATVGSAVAAIVMHLGAGGAAWPAAAWAAAGVGLPVIAYLATIDRVHRLQRWRRAVVVDAVPDRVAELETRLREISIPPRP